MFATPFPDWAGFSLVTTHILEHEQPDATELARLSPHALAARREAFALGRVAARRALRLLGHPEVPILPGPDRAPRWPPGLLGSITHAAGLAAAVVAPITCTGGVGLDIEDMTRIPDTKIARLVSDRDERRWIGGRTERLVSLFSAKESIFKALYPQHGAYFGFEAVHLERRPWGFEGTLRTMLGDWPAGSRCAVRSEECGGLVMTSVCLPPSPPRR